MTAPIELDLAAIEAAAKAATPQDFDSAELKVDEGSCECPACGGEGSVELTAEYTNYDNVAIGVQFFGIGHEFGAAEAYYRAAKPAVVLELIRRLRAAQALVDARIVEVSQEVATVALIGDLSHDQIRELKAFHDALRKRVPGALVMCLQSPCDLLALDEAQMRASGWVLADQTP